VRTPSQANFAPSFIRSNIASSPSRLITVRLPTSTTSLRPSRSRLAFFHVVRNSSTQGSMSLPSTFSLRCDRLSMMEILNMLILATNWVSARHWPKDESYKWLKALMEMKPSQPCVEKCRNQSRHLSRWQGIRAADVEAQTE